MDTWDCSFCNVLPGCGLFVKQNQKPTETTTQKGLSSTRWVNLDPPSSTGVDLLQIFVVVSISNLKSKI